MPKRSAREVAMRYLYLRNMNEEPHEEEDPAEDPLLVDVAALNDKDRAFVTRVAKLYPERAQAIDEAIAANLKRWRFERVAKVDLAILRLAVLEISAMGTPRKQPSTKRWSLPRSIHPKRRTSL